MHIRIKSPKLCTEICNSKSSCTASCKAMLWISVWCQGSAPSLSTLRLQYTCNIFKDKKYILTLYISSFIRWVIFKCRFSELVMFRLGNRLEALQLFLFIFLFLPLFLSLSFSLYLSFSFFQKYLLMLFSYLMYQNISTCENICTVPLLRYVIIKSRSTSLKIQFLAVEARLPLSPRMKQLFLFLCI